MNKKILLVTITVLCSLASQAQQHSLGPTIGFNYATLTNVDNSTGRPGLNIGLTYNYSTLQNWGFGLEAKYSQEGVRVKSGNVTQTTKLDYLRVPVKFQYFFGKVENDFRPKLYGGPSFGLLLGGQSEVNTNGTVVKVDNKDFFNSTDVGLIGGVGFNYRLKKAIWLNTDVAYTHGLTNAAKDGRQESFNRKMSVNLGVTWGF